MHSALQRLRSFHLAYFSRPASDRLLYRLIRRQRIRNIVELGMGSLQRAQRMIWLAQAGSPGAAVRYCAIDAFELHESAAPGRSLKAVFRALRPTGAAVRLLPGDPHIALARAANELTGTDLFIVSAAVLGEGTAALPSEGTAVQNYDSLAKAWFYVPRMLHEHSAVFVETDGIDGKPLLQPLTRAKVIELAESNTRRRAA